MSTTTTTKRRTPRRSKKSPASTPPRAGEGNRSWGRSYVTRSQFLNYKLTDAATPGPGPVTLSAGPGDPHNRVTVALGEVPCGPGDGQDLNLRIAFPCPMLGTQVADGPITLEQALSFEEAVRAVFQAAREHGLIPRRASK